MAECEKGVALTAYIWWVPCEAVPGFYNAYQKTGDVHAAQAIWSYVKPYPADPEEGSKWLSEVDTNVRQPTSRKPIGELRNCPCHNGRMRLEILRRIP